MEKSRLELFYMEIPENAKSICKNGIFSLVLDGNKDYPGDDDDDDDDDDGDIEVEIEEEELQPVQC